ncbi:hypothetical protein COK38_00640 [Bacillus cereus]|uniref:Uncharacterized protein n=1 Tax=Bacillus cereus TaxID=1396 RepID=A0AA44QER4_BACCE|nr:hypothetical protein COJ55_11835 [Bacillus cereus]PFS08066.1 hypothetical protein COK38_00640 [Bacillus cereus]
MVDNLQLPRSQVLLFFLHMNHCYEKQKVTCTHFLYLFLLGMGQEEALTATMHGRMLYPV